MKYQALLLLSLFSCISIHNTVNAQAPDGQSKLRHDALNLEVLNTWPAGPDAQTWRFGLTPPRVIDPQDPEATALALSYQRIFDEDTTSHRIFYVHPEDGRIGVGTANEPYSAKMYVKVNEFSDIKVSAVRAYNLSFTALGTYGVWGSATGDGGTFRYGVFGEAGGNSNARYGVYGRASGPGSFGLFADGNIGYTGNLSEVSDRKLKKNITPFAALPRVMQLQPRTFEMRREDFPRMNLAEGLRYGFVAQELQEVFPELVHEQINGIPYEEGSSAQVEEVRYLGVEYSPLIAVLTQAVQEQQQLIEAKEERITQLEREQRAMERRFALLEDRLAEIEASRPKDTGQSTAPSVQDSGFRLDQNRPNPFGQSTNIAYYIPQTVRSAVLQITDVQGRLLQEIGIDQRGPGEVLVDVQRLPAGTYFYTLVLDGQTAESKKMVLMH